MKKILLYLATTLAIAEVILYSLSTNSAIFVGIQLASPKFRDIYILTLNTLCDTSISDFTSTGSCSDSFYGIPAGSFDYPLSMFYAARILPKILFHSSSALATLLGSTFLLIILAITLRTKLSSTSTLLYPLILLSYPFRYMLERGQTDLVVWIIALLPALFIKKLDLSDDSRHLSNHFTCIFASFMLSLSVAAKAFTAPSLIIWTILLLLRRNFLAGTLSVSMLTLSLYTIYSKNTPPGSHINSIQNTAGEVFGLTVGSSESGLVIHTLTKIAVISLVLMLLVFCSGLYQATKSIPDRHSILFTTEGYSFLISSSSFLALYFLSSSSTYKLVSLAMSMLFSFCIIHSLTAQLHLSSTILTRIRLDSVMYAFIVIPLLFIQYRPYIAGLQFLSQDFAEFILYPASIAINSYYLLIMINQTRITRSTLV